MYVSRKVKGQSRQINSDVKIYEDMNRVASFWICNVKFITGFRFYCTTPSVMQSSTLQICDDGPVEPVVQIFTCHMFTFPLHIIEKQENFILIIWFALCSFASLPVILFYCIISKIIKNKWNKKKKMVYFFSAHSAWDFQDSHKLLSEICGKTTTL